ncbi:MAG: TetR/AcrR family transcriptional regulator [Actinobacteria bacterium]|nr:TetR/AcrR family transcriptional regulator [Actinomycetota bacterium]MBO0836910.1 TetR/AcrR family transcriptional regulator [Actinomycetota bacterium]
MDSSQTTRTTTTRRTRLPAAERRETILRAAAEVFAQAGYRSGKVSDVADRVGVTEPVIFQNFGSKAALFAAVLERAAASARRSLDDFDTDSASALVAHVLDGQPGHRPVDPEHATHQHLGAEFAVLFDDAVTLTTEPELTGPARAAIAVVAEHLGDLIRHAQAEGGIRAHLDPEAAAWLLLSVLAARRLRVVAMPAHLESAVNALVLETLATG